MMEGAIVPVEIHPGTLDGSIQTKQSNHRSNFIWENNLNDTSNVRHFKKVFWDVYIECCLEYNILFIGLDLVVWLV